MDMEKEEANRYASAASLADDLERHGLGELIEGAAAGAGMGAPRKWAPTAAGTGCTLGVSIAWRRWASPVLASASGTTSGYGAARSGSRDSSVPKPNAAASKPSNTSGSPVATGMRRI